MNKDIPPSLARFEGQLERAIGRELKRAPAPKHSWRTRPRVLAGTTVGIAVIATALALALTAASSPPAFAVTRNHDGTVSVKIMRFSGIQPANARLAAMQIHASLVPVRVHCASGVAVPPGKFHPFQTRIKPWRIPRGRSLVLGLGRPGRQVRLPTVHGVLTPIPSGGIRGCMPPPPLCAWRGGRRHNAALPTPLALRKTRAFLQAVKLPNCIVAISPAPKPGH